MRTTVAAPSFQKEGGIGCVLSWRVRAQRLAGVKYPVALASCPARVSSRFFSDAYHIGDYVHCEPDVQKLQAFVGGLLGPYQPALNSGLFADAQNSETLAPAFRETDRANVHNKRREVHCTMGNLTFFEYDTTNLTNTSRIFIERPVT